MNRRLGRAREEVCDNYVLREGDAADYAETLLTISERFRSLRTQPAILGLSDPHWRLEDRVAGLLDSRRSIMVRMHRISLGLVIGLFAAAAVTVAGIRLLRADPPPAPPAEGRKAAPPQTGEAGLPEPSRPKTPPYLPQLPTEVQIEELVRGPKPVNSGPPVQRRPVNKRVGDFPQKTDLSWPESAQAAVYRAIGTPRLP